jgi:hypothetical protein
MGPAARSMVARKTVIRAAVTTGQSEVMRLTTRPIVAGRGAVIRSYLPERLPSFSIGRPYA